jgi:hypothetical protein
MKTRKEGERETIDALEGYVDSLRDRLRSVAQILIEEVGENGPINAEDAAYRAVRIIRNLRGESQSCFTCKYGNRQDNDAPCDRCNDNSNEWRRE